MPDVAARGLAMLVMFVAFYVDVDVRTAIRKGMIDPELMLPGDAFWAEFFVFVARGLFAALALAVLQYLI